jgi:cytolysin-activating lysine-acyltransferase
MIEVSQTHSHAAVPQPRARPSRLAPSLGSDDAGAGHERKGEPKGEPMSKQPSSTGPADGDKNQAASRGTIFDQPAPAGEAKKTSEVLGEITWLMSQSPLHKQLFISDLEWLVMTPMLLQQFRLFYDKDKPIGVVLWASVSEEVEARLAAGNGRMRPQDWKSGDRLWVVEVIAPFGKGEEMVRDLKTSVFPRKDVKLLANARGRREVMTIREP